MAERAEGPRLDLDAIRTYWSSPTGKDKAPSYLTDHAFYEVTRLCDEIERCHMLLRTAHLMVKDDASDAPRISTAIRPFLAAVVSCLDDFGATTDRLNGTVGADSATTSPQE